MGARRVLLALIVAACGDDAATVPDAPAGGEDSGGDIDAPPSSACGYTEAADATNGTSATPEASGLTFAGSTTICGMIHTGHYDAQNELVDQDIFRVTIPADTDVLLHVTAPGAEELDEVLFRVAQASTLGGRGTFVDDHGTAAARLTAGDWFIALGAYHASATTAAIDYKLTLVTDTPATRCPKVTAAGYSEQSDTGTNTGNDVLEFDAAANPQRALTDADDAPEATALMLAANYDYRLSGTLANVQNADDYMDRDTYEFTTGATTKQLTVRLNWQGTTADLDYFLVPKDSIVAFAAGLDNRNQEDEFETFSVKPNTAYWLWIGAYDGATLPLAYDASLCAETFTP